MAAIGIDLGHFHSVVVVTGEAEGISCQVATNALANRSTPSAVAYAGKQRSVGEEAEDELRAHPQSTVTQLLDALGAPERVAAKMAWQEWAWSVQDGKIPVTFEGTEASLLPAHVLSTLLQALLGFAGSPAPVGVAVPDTFGELERQQVADALRLLQVPAKVMPHSHAVASAYLYKEGGSLRASGGRTVLFVDVGFGQTTVTCAQFAVSEGSEKVTFEATSASADVGVRDLLRELFAFAVERIEKKHDLPVKPMSKQAVRLRAGLAKAAKELSMLPTTTLDLECFFPAEDVDVRLELTRAVLEEPCRPVLARMTGLVAQCLAKASVALEAVEVCEGVGGGVRMPTVAEAFRAVLPFAFGAGLDGSSCAATGACYDVAVALRSGETLPAPEPIAASDPLYEAVEAEAWLLRVHEAETTRLAKRNELESYLYQVRGWTSGKDGPLLAAAEPKLDGWILWVEDSRYEDVSLEQYDAKLTEIQNVLHTECKGFFAKAEADSAAAEQKLMEEAAAEAIRRKELGMDFDKDSRKMTKSERLRLAGKQKDEGNELFKAGKFDDAIRRYKKAVDHCTRPEVKENLTPEERETANGIMSSCHMNTAQAYLKAAATQEADKGKNEAEPFYKKAMVECDAALEVADSVKARYRRAICWEKLGEVGKALVDIKHGLKLAPDDKDLAKALEKYEALSKAEKAKSKKMFGKMFG